MPELIALLSSDHEEILSILDQLEREPHGRSDSRLRVNTLAQRLVMRESSHEAVEEIHMWPLVRQHVEGGDDLAERGISQETEGKEALLDFSRMTPDDPPFEETLARVAEAVRAHVAFEQDEVWPALRAAVGEDQRRTVGDEAARDAAKAPTRPHPGTPPTPGTLGTVGKVTALLDRAGDALTGRGREHPEQAEDRSAVSRSTHPDSWEKRKDR